jgi:hypothetical protein
MSHSVVRAPRAASVASNVASTPSGIAKRDAGMAGLAGTA